MLPHLLPLPLVPNPFEALNDYLISAPTGSGKTLAYTIPIINILKQRQVVRLRALIVLPTRDLVVQVRETIEALAKGTGLVVSRYKCNGADSSQLTLSPCPRLTDSAHAKNCADQWHYQSWTSSLLPLVV
jgi:CRISPR/Cas system-associated endonuclease/helicase Cas3